MTYRALGKHGLGLIVQWEHGALNILGIGTIGFWTYKPLGLKMD